MAGPYRLPALSDFLPKKKSKKKPVAPKPVAPATPPPYGRPGAPSLNQTLSAPAPTQDQAKQVADYLRSIGQLSAQPQPEAPPLPGVQQAQLQGAQGFHDAQLQATKAELLRSADDLMRVGGAGQAEASKRLRDIASDPTANNLDELQKIAGTVRNGLLAAQKSKLASQQKQPNGFLKAGVSALGAIGQPIEQATLQPYYASKQAQIKGSNILGQTRAFAGGLPGLGALAGHGKERRAVEATNSYAERARLTQEGKLASVGEFVTGRAQKKLTGLSAKERSRTNGGLGYGILPDQASGGIDAGVQLFGDPVNIGFGLAEDAGKAALQHSLATGGKVAENLISQATEQALRHPELKGLTGHIPGLSGDAAQSVLDAARNGTRADVEAALRQALKDGAWDANVKLRNQALVGLGVRGSVGRSAVVRNTVLETFDKLGRGTAARATLASTRNVDKVLDAAVKAGVAKAETTAQDFYRAEVAPLVANLTPIERIQRIAQIADTTGNAALADATRDVYGDIRKGLRTGGGTISPDIEARLAKAETVVGLATSGGDAADQIGASLSGGLRAENSSVDDLLKQARDNTQVKQKRLALPANVNTKTYMQARINTLVNEPALKEKFLAEVEHLDGVELDRLARRIEGTIETPRLLNEAERLAKSEAERITQSAGAARVGLGRRIAGRVPLDVLESVAPSKISFQRFRNEFVDASHRVEAMDRYLSEFGIPDFTRQMFRSSVENPSSEEALGATVRNAMGLIAEHHGVQPSILQKAFDHDWALVQDRMRFVAGEAGDKIQTVSQRINDIPLPDPSDVKATIQEELAKAGSTEAKLRSVANRAGANILRSSKTKQVAIGATAGALVAEAGNENPLAGAVAGAAAGAVGLQRLHTLWKWTVVTRVPTIALGVAGGAFVDDENRWKGALLGGLAGGVAPLRYIARITAEEKLRTYFERGFTSEQFIPFLSKRLRNRVDLPFLSQDAVRSGEKVGPWVEQKFFHNFGPGWEEINAKGARFIDGWNRIVNYQINVETDPVAEILVHERAGVINAQMADMRLNAFLGTDDGKLLFQRARAGTGGPKTVEEMVSRYRSFIALHMDANLADERLNGLISHDVLKASKKAGFFPEVIHAQQSWVIPRSLSEVYQTVQQMTTKLIVGGPTSNFNREPLAEHIYQREFQRLTENGMLPERAQKIADELATNQTNRIMFQVEDESRLAKKIDFVAPFQQPREELLRVWGRLLVENPVKAAKVVRLTALALNNGQETGMFRRDGSGQFVMSIPGSAWASEHLYGLKVGVNYDAKLKDLLFVGQGAWGLGNSGIGVNVVPQLGGPYWTIASKLFANAHPDTYASIKGNHPWMYKAIFGWDPTGRLAPNETNRLWIGLFNSVPPWSFADSDLQTQEMKKWTRLIASEMYADHLKANPLDLQWQPAEKDVRDAVKSYFRVWSFLGGVFPASPRPTMPTANEATTAREAYQTLYGDDWFRHAVSENPAMEPFLRSGRKWTGPDDYEHWLNRDDYSFKGDRFLSGNFTEKSWADIQQEIRKAQRDTAAYEEQSQAWANPDPLERENALVDWRAKYPDLAARTRDNYFRDQELASILTTYPKAMQDKAIDRWRKTYDVAPQLFDRLKRDIKSVKANPWKAARDTEDVVATVDERRRSGFSEEVAVAYLQPAEQVRYWRQQRAMLSYYKGTDDPKAVLDRYNYFRQQESQIFKEHPELAGTGSTGEKSAVQAAIENWNGDNQAAISGAFDEAARTKTAMDTAAKSKNWKLYYQLKDKRTALFDQVRAIRDKAYAGYPDMQKYQDDVRALLVMLHPDKAAPQIEELQTKFGQQNGFLFVLSSEEKNYLLMPDPVKKAYTDDLLRSLDTPAGQKGKLFWEWLTDFQRDLMSKNLPPKVVADWQAAHPTTGGSGGRKSTGIAELDYAYSLFTQYNKRGSRQAPALYQTYLDMPADPVLRSDFLKKHPEVADWIKLGPMANMPELYRYLVTNTMIKYGKWDGELRTPQEITDLSFAREQLDRWNKRPKGVSAPASYDTWVNMPTGVEKAQYIKAHPEIGDWVKLGPMANMPDDYQEVVRDIMTRYGEWTTKQDPLGDVLNGFYKVPTYARDKYLNEHPELREYWAATRSPEEQVMQNLNDQYFAMADPAMRRLFLAAHPELQQHFLDERTKRYERFLNQVAQFMGSNPEMFEGYLTRQTDILAELLRRYAEAPLVREIPSLKADTGKPGSGEGGRTRRK